MLLFQPGREDPPLGQLLFCFHAHLYWRRGAVLGGDDQIVNIHPPRTQDTGCHFPWRGVACVRRGCIFTFAITVHDHFLQSCTRGPEVITLCAVVMCALLLVVSLQSGPCTCWHQLRTARGLPQDPTPLSDSSGGSITAVHLLTYHES